jgi:predicted lipoprotein with Yx(FWY)xxD motif
MAKGLSRREEQRGWRKLYLWAIPLALVLGIVLVFGVFLEDYLSPPDRTGMDEAAKTQGLASEERKQALTPATVQTQQSETYGEYLADGFGRPLYLFKGDRRSSGDEPAVSTCYEDCAKAWPPLISSGAPEAAGQAKADLLATIERRDGSKQVTYNGWPLYRYVKDFGPEKATGQDVKDFGAEWYLVTPSGEEVHASAEGKS